MTDGPDITTTEYNEVYTIIERAIYPDHCPGPVDAQVVRTTQNVFRALGKLRPSTLSRQAPSTDPIAATTPPRGRSGHTHRP